MGVDEPRTYNITPTIVLGHGSIVPGVGFVTERSNISVQIGLQYNVASRLWISGIVSKI